MCRRDMKVQHCSDGINLVDLDFQSKLKQKFCREFAETSKVCPPEEIIKIKMMVELTFSFERQLDCWFAHNQEEDRHMWKWCVSIDDSKYRNLAPYIIDRVNSVPANPHEPVKPFKF